MQFEIEENLPPIRRKTGGEEEFGALLEALQDGKVISVPATTGEEAQRLAMRIRYFGTKRGFKLTQRYAPAERKLYLQRMHAAT